MLWTPAGEPSIAARHQPALVLDYAHSRELATTPLLKGTGLDDGVSPATLKRHLARHGSHFQAGLDLVRAHKAIYLFQAHGYANEAVAAYLGFHDATNFHRSFKRWTGQTPQLLRHALALFGAV